MLSLCVLMALSGCQEDEQTASGAGPLRESGAGEFSITDEQAEALRALGYVAGAELRPDKVGVTVHDQDRAYEGFNLVLSGSGPRATLMDMDGSKLHTWRYDGSAHYEIQPDRNFLANAHVMDNGDLLAIIDPHGLIKLDKDSSLI